MIATGVVPMTAGMVPVATFRQPFVAESLRLIILTASESIQQHHSYHYVHPNEISFSALETDHALGTLVRWRGYVRVGTHTYFAPLA